MHDLLYSHPGRDTLKPGCYTMRQVAACAVCAGKGWLENVAEQDDEENADEEELTASMDIVLRDNGNFVCQGEGMQCRPVCQDECISM